MRSSKSSLDFANRMPDIRNNLRRTRAFVKKSNQSFLGYSLINKKKDLQTISYELESIDNQMMEN